MMRICNLDTCPVGIATNNPELRKKFTGKPEYVMNFMRFIARELREYMAEMGFRTMSEMIGRTDMLEPAVPASCWKAKNLDLSPLLYKPEVPAGTALHQTVSQDHGLEQTLDMSVLLDLCAPALELGEKVEVQLEVHNTDRAVGTILGSRVTKKYGAGGLPEDTIRLNLTGSSGQSLGAFTPRGVTVTLTGDANDYTGKGLSGGKIIVKPPAEVTFPPEDIRRACETQAKSHLIHLREGFLETQGDARRIASLVAASVPSFRALLVNLARLDGVHAKSREALATHAAARIDVPVALVEQVLGCSDPKTLGTSDAARLYAAYLDAAERLAAFIDSWNGQ
jgi:hypothetical protein